MLTRDVCIKCVNAVEDKPFNRWGFSEEAYWGASHVYCPRSIVIGSGLLIADVTETPPKWCPHKFEHGVAEGMTDAD